MNTLFDRASETLEHAVAQIKRHPLVHRGLGLMLTLVLYSAGVLAADAVSGEAIFPVAIVAVYFLPAVLRAWMLFYWEVRKDVRELREHLQSHKVA